MTTTRILLASTLLATVGCGDDKALICEPGTFESDTGCVAVDPTDATAPTTTADATGGRVRGEPPARITLTSDEPATIYVTTDGTEPDVAQGGEPSPVLLTDITAATTLRYFAVDAAGNREATKTLSFDLDNEAPGRPGLALTVTGTSAALTITPATAPDLAGTLVARVTGDLDAMPEPGTLYTVGQDVSTKVRVVSVGAATTFTDPDRPAGPVRYAAWSYDDLGNYSMPRIVAGEVALGPLTGEVAIATSTGTVTLPTPIAHVPLTATATTSNGTTTVQLTLTNQTTRYLQAPKLAFTSLTGGTIAGHDGTHEGAPYLSFGPGALAPGAAVTRPITFTGVATDATVTFGVEVRHNPLLAWGAHPDQRAVIWLGDLTTVPVGAPVSFSAPVRGRNGNRGAQRVGCGSLDGHFLFSGNQHHGRIERYDLATRVAGGGAFGSPEPQYVSDALCDGQGSVYAVLAGGGRRDNNRARATVGLYQVVRYTEGLIETGRVQFEAEAERGMPYAAISPDGRVVAVPTRNEIQLVDTETMTVIATTVGGTAGPLAMPTSTRIRHLLWSADGQALYAQAWSGTLLVRFAFTGPAHAGVATRTSTGTESGGRTGELARGADGKLWIANEDQRLAVYDPETGTTTGTAYPHQARGVEVVGSRLFVTRADRNTIDEVDATGAVIRSTSLPQVTQQHKLGSTR